ncbi:hypothetical protein ACQ4PT_002934 [Festuca glaucescens]
MGFISLLWLLIAFQMVTMVKAGDETALLAFKAQAGYGGSRTLASWNGSAHFCSWEGVMCSHRRPTERVIALNLHGSMLKGALSPALGNLTFLRMLNLSSNGLHGEIPASLGRLRRLQTLDLSFNSLSGMLPANLSSCIRMTVMALDSNKLDGRIPAKFGETFTSLATMSLRNNSFTGPIPASLSNLSHLHYLDLSNNQLVGSVPPGLSSIQNMKQIYLYANKLSGMLPPLYNLSSLQIFQAGRNMLSGSILADIGNKLPKIQILSLGRNQFTGHIPSSLSNLSDLVKLGLGLNRFSGYVPHTLGRLGALQDLDLAENRHEANDKEGWEFITALANCSQLQKLYLYSNSFEGQLPGSIANLSTTLQKLFLNDNRISGSIPADIGNLVGLTRLVLVNTSMSGVIPESIGRLENLIDLGLYSNSLTGLIPPIVILLVRMLRKKLKQRQKIITPPSVVEDQYERIPYHAILRGTNGFSEDNLLGRGRYGAVYKCALETEDRTLAVKVFNLHQSGSSKSFEVECEAMRRIRHRCLVKIITCCSSVDHQGEEFKALVFEIMPHGSLDGWLHPKSQNLTASNTLSLSQRLDIAVDIVDAVEYLHNHCEPLVIHCNLKPSNILLAEDMSARVGDFGISNFLTEATSQGMLNSYSTTGISGTIGYVAPEYGEGSAVSTHGDIYSLGILLIEMFTGRSPTDDMFRDALDLHRFAKYALPNRTLEIADSTIWLQGETQDNTATSRIQECLVSVFKLGISCSKQQPQERSLVREAAIEMHAIRDAYLVLVG